MDPVRLALLEQFKGDERARFLAVLMRMARADDVSAKERDHLQPVADWMGASESELAQAIQLAHDVSISLEQLVGGGFQHNADKGLLLYRESCAVVWVDTVKSPDEGALLSELGRVLGISEDYRQVLDSPLACSPEGERRFLTLLGGTYSTQIEG
jgi:hypothetical protein